MEPVSTCGACQQTDNAPKHQVLVGYNNAHTMGEMFHPHDADRDGVIHYHFDCPSEWHDLATVLGVHPDPDAQAHNVEVAAAHARIVALAKSGVHGDDLRARIVAGEF